jgi:signal transduction histidine kinase
MSRPRTPTAAAAVVVVVAASAVLAGVMARSEERTWIDWVFATVVFSGIGLLGLKVARDWRETRRVESRAHTLSRLVPDEVARDAVRAERERLMAEISAGLRATLVAIRGEALAASTTADAALPAARIHDQARAATAELRRQLGLLRTAEVTSEEAGPGPRTAVGPSRGDLLLGAAAGCLAVVESLLWPSLEGRSVSVWSAVLGGLAGATVLGRRAWPEAAALVCAGAFLLGVSLSVPVYPGFWFLVTVCGLLWTLAAEVPGLLAAATGAALVGSVLIEVGLTEPQNVGFDAVLMGLAVSAGLLTRAARWRSARSHRRAEQRDAELAAASRSAVQAERATIARELHDTVSHAVGLIAMQSAAAMVSADRDPGAARANLELVRCTADAALAELDHASVGDDRSRTLADLTALTERIRAAGTVVRLQLDPGFGPELPDPVYRVVQEALTNVVRHAPGAVASVRIGGTDGGVVVDVVDDGPGAGAGTGRGYGLVGLTERVRFAGGSLATSPGPGGKGFRVLATLPSPQDLPA